MAKRSDEALTGLLGLGSQSARKSHYSTLQARLEELETERNRYKWLFEHAVHGIFQASLDRGVLAANPAMARMLGYDDPQQVLWSPEDVGRLLFAGGEHELQRLRQVLSEKPGLFGYETRFLRKDGSQIDVLVNLLNKPDEPGVFEGFVADISERVLAQKRMAVMNSELERRVYDRTVELMETNRSLQQEILQRTQVEEALREARDAAEEANRSKDKYLAAASHDLLQPLNAARLLISTLRERELPAAEQLLVERSHQALEGAEDLLSDLLDISKLDQAGVRPDFDSYRLEDILGPLVSEFEPVARAAGLSLRSRIPALTVRTDFRLLTRILRNFLSNACRYTEQGAVLLAARKGAQWVEFQVWDTGRGIAADQLQHIFLEFSQLDVERASERKGVGLGLAIVERIATLLEAPLKVRSWPGRGSVFSIRVPLSQAAVAPRSRLAASPVGDPLPGRRVLVVDNESSILHSMSALLSQWGCQVLCAHDWAEACTALGEQAPEVILADYHLDHDVRGPEVIQALRQRFQQSIPAVIISADRGNDCRRELQQLQLPMLNKPVKPGKLRAILSQLLVQPV